ncbi:MAG: geranylgeranyl reductase family protein [Candidatus Methylomirabilia bacterium]
MDYDVIVVGAGPGGSTAAYELAHRGVKVGLFERKRLPRYKPCGGCLSLKIDRILAPDFHPLVEQTVYGARFTFKGLRPIRRRSDRPVAYMVMRDRFDAFLAGEARKGGAELREAEPVTAVREQDDGVEVVTERRTYRAQFLVGADGATGIVARALGLQPGKRVAVALEGEATVSAEMLETVGDEAWIEFGSIPVGYAWVFPKCDHLSVGVGGLKGRVGNPRAYYSTYIEDEGLLTALEREERHGYIIPVFDGGREPIRTARTLLVGDAGALVDPFLGEGIYYAIRSGQLAAETLEGALAGQSKLDAYDTLLEEEIYPEFRAARKMGFLLYAFPETGYEVLTRRPRFIEAYFEALRGDGSYDEMWRMLKGAAVRDVVRSFWPFGKSASDLVHHYDRLAPRYDGRLRLWRELIGAGAWEHLGDLFSTHVKDAAAVLDAGTGTGEAIRLLLNRAGPAEVVGVDLSKGMLREAKKKIQDAHVTFSVADILHLPYPDRRFDVAVCAWTLETLTDQRAAVEELLRVIRDDGYVIYAFASAPPEGIEQFYASLVERLFQGSLRWRLLSRDERPYHDCEHSSLATFAHGLSTVVVLRKCCAVKAPVVPQPVCAEAAGAVRLHGGAEPHE